MSCILVALVIWLYFMKIINYCALKVKIKLKLGAKLKQECSGLWVSDARQGVLHPSLFPGKECIVNPLLAVCLNPRKMTRSFF